MKGDTAVVDALVLDLVAIHVASDVLLEDHVRVTHKCKTYYN